jgi:hypothetical protein
VTSVPGGDVLGPGDVPDTFVPQPDDMVDRHLDAPAIVDGHGWDGSVLQAAVDKHERRATGGRLGKELHIQPGRGGDETIDLTGAHGLDLAPLTLNIVVRVDDQQRVPSVAEAVLDAAQNRRKERVGEIV